MASTQGKISMQEIGITIPSAVQMCFKKVAVLKDWQLKIILYKNSGLTYRNYTINYQGVQVLHTFSGNLA